MVAEPCTIQTIKVPNHYRVPTLAPLAIQIYMGTGGEGWDPRSRHTRADWRAPSETQKTPSTPSRDDGVEHG